MPKYTDLFKKLNNKRFMAVVAAAGVAGGTALSGVDITKIGQQVSPTQSQRDNYVMPLRTCNSSSNAMYLNYYRPLNPDTARQGYIDDDTYLASVLKRGDTIYHEVQTEALKAYGLDTVWKTDGNMTGLIKQLQDGHPSVVNILHRGKVGNCGSGNVLRGGHVILLRGWDASKGEFIVADPFGSLCRNYQNGQGMNYRISKEQFRSRWQGGWRSLSKAQMDKYNYRAGQVQDVSPSPSVSAAPVPKEILDKAK